MVGKTIYAPPTTAMGASSEGQLGLHIVGPLVVACFRRYATEGIWIEAGVEVRRVHF